MKKAEQIIEELRLGADMVFNPIYKNTMKEAADTIEALLADLKKANVLDTCDICAHGQKEVPCVENDYTCDVCTCDCPCKNCRGNSGFEWRGVQSKEQTKEEEHE